MSDHEDAHDPTEAASPTLAPDSPARGGDEQPNPAQVVPLPDDDGKSPPPKVQRLPIEEEEDGFLNEVWRWCCCRRVHSSKRSSVEEAVSG